MAKDYELEKEKYINDYLIRKHKVRRFFNDLKDPLKNNIINKKLQFFHYIESLEIKEWEQRLFKNEM